VHTYNTIYDSIQYTTCAHKLTKSQLNLAHGIQNGKIKKKIKPKLD